MTGTATPADGDFRRADPRFQEADLAANRKPAETLADLAAAKGVTPAQLALAWVLAQGDDIVTNPGTTRAARVEENVVAGHLTLTAGELETLSALGGAAGDRYPEFLMNTIDSLSVARRQPAKPLAVREQLRADLAAGTGRSPPALSWAQRGRQAGVGDPDVVVALRRQMLVLPARLALVGEHR
nr:aldo/keto reductase [Nonomuraea polychroma]